MQLEMFVDKVLVSVIGILVYFVVRFLSRFTKWRKSIDSFLEKYVRFSVDDWQRDVALPAVVSATLLISLAYVLGVPLSYQEPIGFLILFRGLVGPVSEEILFRGLLLGFLLYLPKMAGRTDNKLYRIFSLFLVTGFFVISHGLDQSIYQIKLRFVTGLLFGGLYVAYQRNLVPPIVAHVVNNLIIIVKDIGLF